MIRPGFRADRSFLFCLATSVAVFVVFGLWALSAPGLYMDAMNPDYEVVKLIDPKAPVTIWAVPGNMLLSRFPILWGLYGGSYAVYWSAPFYLLLGGSVASVRIAHVSLGILLVCLLGLMARRLTKSTLVSSITIMALALDPVFIYSFRTQAYEVLFSAPLLLFAIYAMYRFPSLRGYFFAGVLLGLSAFGYFVNLFALPGLILFATGDRDLQANRLKTLGALLIGLFVGSVPYFIGYGLILGAMGFGPGLAWFHDTLNALHVSGAGDATYLGRIASIASATVSLLNSSWIWQTIWTQPHSDAGQSAKAIVLLLLPLVALLCKRSRSRAGRAFTAVVYPTYSFLLSATYFGSRLGGHDLIAIIPLIYLSVAVAIPVLLKALNEYRIPVIRVFSVIGILLLGSNAFASVTMANRLSNDRGAGMYSGIFSDLADRALAEKHIEPYVFWNWGEMMPFIYQTHGLVPAFSDDQFAGTLCQYGAVNVVFSGADALISSPTFSFKDLRLVRSVLLHDRSSNFPMRIVTVRSTHPAEGCVAKPASDAAATAQSQQASDPEPGLRISSSSIHGVSFVSDPQVAPYPQGGPLPIITVIWKAPAAKKIEIHMGSPNGVLFAAGTGDGSQATGAWVQPGVKFYLQDVDEGSPGKTISVLTASACSKCSQ